MKTLYQELGHAFRWTKGFRERKGGHHPLPRGLHGAEDRLHQDQLTHGRQRMAPFYALCGLQYWMDRKRIGNG